ncbi:preprotein translocase subunit YajC [Desulfovulcanus ferrireducens]|uniref:preprotein translocase subunit YajC n=1 Tax=Desulfovulcanus ferrireducens TaxID=2831190 RepID=UPI00207BAC5C|nr:preprotein translocase subunit YajC [Desulfovulcanus ferrireducens]
MFFTQMAYAMGQAGGAQAGEGNPLTAFVPLLLMFAIFYFLLIRPQQKKAKEHQKLLANLKKGDYILTNGGIYGRIVGIDGEVLTIELADNVQIKVNRGYVAGLADSGQKDKPKSKEKK